MSKVYVASSWRNNFQEAVVDGLRRAGHEVYDLKNPPHGRGGFAWSDIDPNWESWTTEEYTMALRHSIADEALNSDFDGMKWADTCIMVLPCGRSANTEAGWMKGAGKKVYVLSPTKQEPELMYKIYDGIFATLPELLPSLSQTEQPAVVPDTVNLYQVQQTCPHCGTEYFGVCSCSPGATTTTTGTHMVINLPNTETTSVSDPKTECTCICGPSDENPNCEWPNCFKPEKSAVPDPKGEIPDEITDWITHTAEQIWENERAIMEPGELATKVATAMYRKMREEIGQFKRAARIASQNEDYCKQWLYKARQERDALQTTLDTAQQSKQVLIDALTAKSEESADCRKALEKIVFGSDGMLSLPDRARMYGIAQQTLAKYPNP